MTRTSLFQAALTAIVLVAAHAGICLAQGMVVVEGGDVPVRLPRPYYLWPPMPPFPPGPAPRPLPQPAPQPETSYQVKAIEVEGRLANQVAEVQVSQTFANTGNRTLEGVFVFPLPYDGAIEQMTLLVDGKEFPAKLLDAKEARSVYEGIVRRNRDPALLEWIGTGMFKSSVFPIPPGEKRKVTLRYSQFCRAAGGLVDFLFPLSTAKYTERPVEDIRIALRIESPTALKNIYSPSHAVTIEREGKRQATVTYRVQNEVPQSDFRLFYDAARGPLSTRVLCYRPDANEDGYFMLLTAPEITGSAAAAGGTRASEAKPSGEVEAAADKAVDSSIAARSDSAAEDADDAPPAEIAKTVVFVVDRSGSMSGKKIEQVRAALKDVLVKLRPGDTFNIVAYDSRVELFRPELQRFDDKTRRAALGFIKGLYAGGSTNIEGALRAALGQLQDRKRPSYVVFLTDGLPTDGETNESKIVADACAQNKVRARVFTFGVGYDVNSRLLDRVARENHGYSDYVRPEERIENAVATLCRRIEAPVLTDVRIEFALDAPPSEGQAVNRVYPEGELDLFAGEQLVLVGRYNQPGAAKAILRGKLGDALRTFEFPADLVTQSKDDTNAFIEKLWAARRVGAILEQIDLKGENPELVNELVALSKKHGILTPYTSFFADDQVPLNDAAANRRLAGERLRWLHEAAGAGGVAQRAAKNALQRSQQAPSAATPSLEAVALDASAGRADQAGDGFGGGGGGGFGASGRSAAAHQGRQQRGGQQYGGMGGGMGGGLMPAGPVATSGPANGPQVHGQAGPANASGGSIGSLAENVDDVRREAALAGQNMRTIGNRTFFRRQNQWIDSRASDAQQARPQRVRQFSDEYFKLAERHGREISPYLAVDEPILVVLDDTAYLIEP